MDKVILWSVNNRWLVAGIALAFSIFGVYVCTTIPVDIFPDLTAPVVAVLTEAPGFSPSEVESLVTFPLETFLNGAPGIRRIRSVSLSGFSVVWAEFDWGEKMNTARQIVTERLTLAASELPPDVPKPVLAPPTSLLGEIQLVALQSDIHSLEDLHNYADTILRRRLLAVPGIAQVTLVGSGSRQYQVWLDPTQLSAFNVTVSDVVTTLQYQNANTPAGMFNENGTEYLVTGLGRLRTVKEIEDIPVVVRDSVPVRIGDVGHVRIGPGPVRGTGSANGKPAILLFIQRRPEANTLALDRIVKEVLDEEAQRLPEGMTLDVHLMRQADFIRTAVRNVTVAIRDGAVLLIVIMALFLFNVRAMLISLTALPLSLMAAVIIIYFFGGSINTMTLGGLAIAVGSLMDDAVIDVENTVRRLRLNALRPATEQRSPLYVVYQASTEVRSAIVFATFIITVVFLPLYALQNVEGRLLHPLAAAYIVSIFASLLAALTVTPALEGILLPSSRYLQQGREPRIAAYIKRAYSALLRRLLPHPWMIALPVSAALIIAIAVIPFMGRTFLPDFNEGALNLIVNTLPGTSLKESDRIGRQVEHLLMDIPEITSVARKTGRGELDEHAQGVEGSEFEATFSLQGRGKEAMLDEIRAKLAEIPGISFGIGGPIAHRIDHLLSGARAAIAIKFSGDNLYTLRELANEARLILEDIPGVTDIVVEPQTDVPEIHIQWDHFELGRREIPFGEADLTLRAALHGVPATRIYEGRNAYDLVLRIEEQAINTLDGLKWLPIRSSTGILVPLGAVATITRSSGPNIISRDQVQRKIFLTCNPSGRDVASVVADIRKTIDPLIANYPGYTVHYGGQFESASAATRRLLASGFLVIVGIFVLLSLAFRNTRDALFVMVSLPLALIGGVVAVFFFGSILSIASIIGFISVFGVAARNSIMLINHIRYLQQEEGISDFFRAVWQGAEERIIPVLMTALSTALALLPLVIAHDAPGNEIQSPMASVIIGGLLSATLLNVVLLPALYLRFGKPVSTGTGVAIETPLPL